jgi:peptide/nickel transport system substrate-binding protein
MLDYTQCIIKREGTIMTITRRQFTGGSLATSVTLSAAMPSGAWAQAMPAVPRERTLIATAGNPGATQFDNFTNFNPLIAGNNIRINAIFTLEPLFYYNNLSGDLIPWQAEGHAYNADHTELTVTLRAGVTWSDGEAFDADDVVFTLTTLIENGRGKADLREARALATDVAAVEKVDARTVRIRLVRSLPRFLFRYLVAYNTRGLYMVPEHIYKTAGDLGAFTALDPTRGTVGTGPYRLVRGEAARMVFDLRDDWWAARSGFKPKPAVERLILVPFTDRERAMQQLLADDVDIVLDTGVGLLKQMLAAHPKLTTISDREPPFGNIDWFPTSLFFNHADPQWADIRIRRAVGLYINKQQVVDVAWEGANEIASTPFPDFPALRPFIQDAAPVIQRYRVADFDRAAGDRLMRDAGAVKDGQGFWTLGGKRLGGEMGYVDSAGQVPHVVSEQLRRAGFENTLNNRPGVRQRLFSGAMPWGVWGHTGSVFDPYDTLELYHSKFGGPVGQPAFWLTRWSNADYDRIVDQIATIPMGDARLRPLVANALEILLREQVEVPLAQFYHRTPMNRTYWTNWPTKAAPYAPPTFWAFTAPLLVIGLRPTR